MMYRILLTVIVAFGLLPLYPQIADGMTDCAIQTEIPQAECTALVALYDSTDGTDWASNTGWNVTDTPCTWHGVVCAAGNVVSLGLVDNRLRGTVPDLSALTQLQLLYLSENELVGDIPDFSTMTALRVIDLRLNQLSNGIPETLFGLENLQELYLDSNQLSGSIPELPMGSGIETLRLNSNQLSGVPPASLCQVSSLRLTYNKLEAESADSCFGDSWHFSQTVPPSNVIATASSTTTVLLSWSAIGYVTDGGRYEIWGRVQGDSSYTLLETTTDKTAESVIVTGLQPETMYEFVIRTFSRAHDQLPYFQQNDLTSIDSALVSAETLSPTLGLCATQLDIPYAECATLLALYEQTDGINWTNSTEWDAADTPCGWYGITCTDGHVQYLNLRNNQLHGTLPDLSALAHVEIIDLGWNQLDGIIPDLSALVALNRLFLSYNQLDGIIPELATLSELQILYLDNNALTGELPDTAALERLFLMDVHNNRLSGTISPLSTHLETLHLENNRFSGQIPDLTLMDRLGLLYLANNQLSGAVPDSICQVTQLVDIGYNKLMIDTAEPCIETADPDWKATQTVPPLDMTLISTGTTSVSLGWTPINYTADDGYYEVWGKIEGTPTYTLFLTTTNKTVSGTMITELQPDTTYEFIVRTVTSAHDVQQNELVSEDSEMVMARTAAPIPLSVQLTQYTAFQLKLPLLTVFVGMMLTYPSIRYRFRRETFTGHHEAK